MHEKSMARIAFDRDVSELQAFIDAMRRIIEDTGVELTGRVLMRLRRASVAVSSFDGEGLRSYAKEAHGLATVTDAIERYAARQCNSPQQRAAENLRTTSGIYLEACREVYKNSGEARLTTSCVDHRHSPSERHYPRGLPSGAWTVAQVELGFDRLYEHATIVFVGDHGKSCTITANEDETMSAIDDTFSRNRVAAVIVIVCVDGMSEECLRLASTICERVEQEGVSAVVSYYEE